MISINLKVAGLTQPGFKSAGSGLEPEIFWFPDLPEWEAGTLLYALLIATPTGHRMEYYVNLIEPVIAQAYSVKQTRN